MPPLILAGVAAGAAAVPVVVVAMLMLGPFLLPLWLRTMNRLDRERLLAATKGAYLIVSEIARKTPMSLDDDIAKIIKMVEDETSKTLKPSQRLFVQNVAHSMHVDPNKPDLSPTLPASTSTAQR